MVLVPSTTKLSILLFPVAVVAPLKTMRKAAFGLLFKPGMLPRSNTTGTDPNATGGAKVDPKSTNVAPSRLYWN